MKTIILCAGMGSRLRPLTNDYPKCMVPLHGRPLLQHHVDVLVACGQNEIYCLTGYKADQIHVDRSLEKIHNPQYDTTNMVNTLFCARRLLQGPLIIAYGDIVYSTEVLQKLISAPSADLTVVSDRNWKSYWQQRFDDPLSDAETFKLGPDNRILEIGKKTHSFEDIQGQYIGLMRFSEEGTRKLVQAYDHLQTVMPPDKFNKLYMTDIIQHMINSDLNVQACMIERSWFEVDDVRDLKTAESHTRLSGNKLVFLN